MGVVSFSPELAEGEVLTAVYRTEVQAESPEAPCLGNVNEPTAEAGFLCVYRAGNFGSLEKQDENAAFYGFESPEGLTGKVGRTGALVLFRTKEFKEETVTAKEKEEAEHIKKQSELSAGGSWAAGTVAGQQTGTWSASLDVKGEEEIKYAK